MKDYSNYYPSSKNYLRDSGGILFDIQQANALHEGNTVLIDGVSSNVIIQEHTNPYGEYREERIILCLASTTIKRGSFVYWNDEYWLVVTDIDFNGVYTSTKMVKCNNVLVFKNMNGTKITIPTVLSNQTVMTDGVKESEKIVTYDTMRFALLPYNNDTKQIFLQQRFMMNHNSVFEVSNIDDYTYAFNKNDSIVGLIKLTMTQCEFVVEDEIGKSENLAYNDMNIVPIVTGKEIVLNGNNSLSVGEESTYSIKYDDGTSVIGDYSFAVDNGRVVILSHVNTSCLIKGISSGQVKITATNVSDGTKVYSKIISINNVW